MKHLIIYDSQYGNTGKVAEAIAQSLPQAQAIQVNAVTKQDLKNLETLVVGSPTQGGRPTQAIQTFIDQLPAKALNQVKVAAFDTGFKYEDQNFALKLLIKAIGYAAPKIAQSLQAKGGKLMLQPKTFIVTGKEGPLASGELALAAKWLKSEV